MKCVVMEPWLPFARLLWACSGEQQLQHTAACAATHCNTDCNTQQMETRRCGVVWEVGFECVEVCVAVCVFLCCSVL